VKVDVETVNLSGEVTPSRKRRTSDDDAAWREAGQGRFEAAYAEEDSVYESLISEKPAE
jgi:hypothetical protein